MTPNTVKFEVYRHQTLVSLSDTATSTALGTRRGCDRVHRHPDTIGRRRLNFLSSLVEFLKHDVVGKVGPDLSGLIFNRDFKTLDVCQGSFG